ncbi:MAG: aldehyde dehydrogenase family protein [Pseudorhodoplanes sp.]|uniref:aldehyde dehydrogenase family protein n=1 Tax=Pseudorhodoplanes sp. TaxID=1934341 RepID=UPI003D14A35C
MSMLIGGRWREASRYYDVRDPYGGDVIARAPLSDDGDLDAALSAAVRAKSVMAAMPGYQRADLLRRAGTLIDERSAALANLMVQETGKTIRDARAEVTRSRETLLLAAEEAVRIEGEHVPLDASAQGAGKLCFLMRFPVGVIAAVTPFNAPLNLACHKIGPALAAGNAVVLKAPPQAPGVIWELSRIFADAGAPEGSLNVLYGDRIGPSLVKDHRVDFISFTGSTRAGAQIKAASGLKRVALELGGTGTTIVHSDAEVEKAAILCARNAMRLAGQSCISVQTVMVHRAILDDFLEAMLAEVARLRLGDPSDEATDVGPVIDESSAVRIESWVAEAVRSGARVLSGGTRAAAMIEPTVLINVESDMRVVSEEVFGPVASVMTYDALDEAYETISGSRYGLQTGIFTRSLETALQAVRCLRTGGVIINGTSTWRTDQMPYGGIKNSGMGREGPKFAIRDMTEERLVLFNI